MSSLSTASSPNQGTPEERRQKVYKKALCDSVRELMLSQASQYLLAELQRDEQRDALVSGTGLEFECDCLKRKTSCDLCRAPCTNFVEGVLGVLERDFVQLRHGKGSKLLENRNGIQFLLTGITLGLLYESMPEKTGVDELVLQVLIVMLTPRVWQRALEQYGVAPPQSAPRWQVQSGAARKQRSYSARSTGFKKGGAMKDVGAHLPPSSDPNVCSECKVVFQTADMMQECDCNTVTIRYKQRLRPEKSAAANGAPGFMEEIEAQSRPRSHSF